MEEKRFTHRVSQLVQAVCDDNERMMISLYHLDTEKYDYENKVVSIKMNVQEMIKTLEASRKSARILSIAQSVLFNNKINNVEDACFHAL